MGVILSLINISFRNRLIRVYSPVTHKRPVRTITVRRRRIHFHYSRLFLVMSSLVDQRAKWIRNKTATPELHRPLLLKAHPVNAAHMHPLAYGMTPLDG